MKIKSLLAVLLIIQFTSCETINTTLNDISTRIASTKEEKSTKAAEKNINQLLQEHEISYDRFQQYKTLNENEKRLLEYKDDDIRLIAKIILLDYINKSREGFNRNKVDFDILASRVANKMSIEAAENGFRGHWNLRGEKPYHRYSLAGGTDHVAENAAAAWSSENFVSNVDNAIKMMKDSHDRFMAEKAPNDGHKQNVINEYHNYVGLGYAYAGTNFRYYEEYIDRYIHIEVENIYNSKGKENIFCIKPFDNSFIYALIVYREPKQQNMTSDEINKKSSYQDFSTSTAYEIWPWELPKPSDDGYTEFRLKFFNSGVYYVQCYIDDKPNQNSRRADTKDKIQASGLVFYIE